MPDEPAITDSSPIAASPESRRLRVALLSFDFGESVVPLANGIARSADVCLLLPQRELDLFNGPVDPSVDVFTFAKPRLRQAFRQLHTISRIVRRIRRFRPDVVHVQQGHLWLNPFLRLLRRYPLVVTVHDPVPHPGDRGGAKTPQFVMNLAFTAADGLIVHARALVADLEARAGIDQKKVHVIPHLVDPVVTNVDGTEEPATILFFGRIWPYKGVDVLIRAEPRISERAPALRIIIAGEGEEFGRYRAMMQHPDRFEVHNSFVDNETRSHLFARASVVVLPYLQASQSGVVPIAYAFAKPVVATAVGGLPELVEDGVTGLVVPPGDADALAEAVNRLLADDGLRHRLGANGRQRFESTLSAEALAEGTLAVYRAVQQHHGRR